MITMTNFSSLLAYPVEIDGGTLTAYGDCVGANSSSGRATLIPWREKTTGMTSFETAAS